MFNQISDLSASRRNRISSLKTPLVGPGNSVLEAKRTLCRYGARSVDPDRCRVSEVRKRLPSERRLISKGEEIKSKSFLEQRPHVKTGWQVLCGRGCALNGAQTALTE